MTESVAAGDSVIWCACARGEKSKRYVYEKLGILPTTARDWERVIDKLGILGRRLARERSTRLGRKPAISDEEIDSLLDPTNPVRDQRCEAQIKHHTLDIGPCRLPAQLLDRTNNAQLFKKQVVPKLKPEQLDKRKT